MTSSEPKIFRRSSTSVEAWRDTKAGMWAWILQRVSAVILVFLAGAHLMYPYTVLTQVLLLFTLIFHGVLGIRVVLMDLGVGGRFQKPLTAGLLLLGLVIFLSTWWAIF